ncbi:hypothetical protein [Embleya sp. AB8]|uniref:hypothetical protein n=1 Tax=Embleya sp. AB8 TaxID=3156304 RepID=UPI003C76996D
MPDAAHMMGLEQPDPVADAPASFLPKSWAGYGFCRSDGRATVKDMAAEWWSIEVFDAGTSARSWQVASADPPIRRSADPPIRRSADPPAASALTAGALMWQWRTHSRGLVFEISFRDEADWQAWRALPAVRAALDAVPDPIAGLHIHRGRGGAAGEYVPRRPRPAPSAAAVELPEDDPPRRSNSAHW